MLSHINHSKPNSWIESHHFRIVYTCQSASLAISLTLSPFTIHHLTLFTLINAIIVLSGLSQCKGEAQTSSMLFFLNKSQCSFFSCSLSRRKSTKLITPLDPLNVLINSYSEFLYAKCMFRRTFPKLTPSSTHFFR